ncbi:hypothetical protein AKG09_08640, partial [Neisseria sp. 83E34]
KAAQIPDNRVSEENKGNIGIENSRNPVFGHQLLGKELFCKGLKLVIYEIKMGSVQLNIR